MLLIVLMDIYFTGKLVEIYRYLPTCLLESLYYWLVQASCLLIKGKPTE
jgi:hypothetical protein